MWRAERLVDLVAYRALSKQASTPQGEPLILVKDASTAEEGPESGHEGSRGFSATHLVTEFVRYLDRRRQSGAEGALEILDMGIAACVDLRRRPIVAQNIASCYCIVLICRLSGRAALCHVPDGFAQRMVATNETSAWGRAAFDHTIARLVERLVDTPMQPVHALVVGGEAATSYDDFFALKVFLIALFTYDKSPETRARLAASTDAVELQTRTIASNNMKGWAKQVAGIDFTPLLLNPFLYQVTNELVHRGIPGIKERFAAGRAWAVKAYPLRDEAGRRTAVGEFIYTLGGRDFERDLADRVQAGRRMRNWLAKTPGIQCEAHIHLNERTNQMNTTTVAVAMIASQPVVYIGRLPQDARDEILVDLSGDGKRRMRLRTVDKGCVILPYASRVDFGQRLRNLTSQTKHLGIFLYDNERLRLVTTRAQYLAYLEKFGMEAEAMPLASIPDLDRARLGPCILPDDEVAPTEAA